MFIEILKAFLVGGIFCAVGQLLIDYTKMTPARILVLYVVAGVFLSGFGFYGKIVEFGGAGATVPLLGFGHSLADGVGKAVNRDGFFGIFTGALSATSAGITVALLTAFVVSLLFKSKAK